MENTKLKALALSLISVALSACYAGGGNQGNNQDGSVAQNPDMVSGTAACGDCTRSNADNACVNGMCQWACKAGYADCDSNMVNGCEVNKATDSLNCGACGNVCNDMRGAPVCTNNRCGIQCAKGYDDCDGNASNGCETRVTTDANCGSCGNACAGILPGSHCMMDMNNMYTCTCPVFLETCPKGCFDFSSDPKNCGGCGKVCSGDNKVCSGGSCQLSCPGNLTECNGSCVDINTNLLNCGGCGNTCNLQHVTGPVCRAGVCDFGGCAKGYADCDGDRTNGCEVNTDADVNHCGGCGPQFVCNTPHATPDCKGGKCGIAICFPGYDDCNKSALDGCEVSLTTDAKNCGACGNSCPALPNATAACKAASCGLGACNPGWGDCNGDPSDGCETNLMTDPLHCGGCAQNRACSFVNANAACVGGVCRIDTCFNGFGNCGNVCINILSDPNNCGSCGFRCVNNTPSCINGRCMATCDDKVQNQDETGVDCGGVCVSYGKRCLDGGRCIFASDCASGYCLNGICIAAPNCGDNTKNGNETDVDCGGGCVGQGKQCANGKRCVIPADCISGVCPVQTLICAAPTCFDGLKNGNETDVDCGGSCQQRCANYRSCLIGGDCVSNICQGGTCQPLNCQAGTADCNNNPLDACETNTNNDINNCGVCRFACNIPNAMSSCQNGNCIGQCKGGFGDCDGNVQNGCESTLTTDRFNCGVCGKICPIPNNGSAVCNSGVCGIAICNGGFGDCNNNPGDGCEVDLRNNAANCGACNAACPNGQSCNGGVCGLNCGGNGTADCDRNAGNGCEVNINTDVNNCGLCGNQCSFANATSTCVGGGCSINSCNQGFGNCNNVAGDGCETNLTTSFQNCGACGKVCANGQSCQNSVCVGNQQMPDGGLPDGGGFRTICVDVPLPVVGDGGVKTENVCGIDQWGKLNKGMLPEPVGNLCLGPLTDDWPDNVDRDCDCGVAGPVVDGTSRSMCPDLCPANKLWAGDCDDTWTGHDNNPAATNWCDNFANNCHCNAKVPDDDPNVCGGGRTCDGHGVCK